MSLYAAPPRLTVTLTASAPVSCTLSLPHTAEEDATAPQVDRPGGARALSRRQTDQSE